MQVTQACPTPWRRGLYSPWNSLGQNTGVGSLSLLQGIFTYIYILCFLTLISSSCLLLSDCKHVCTPSSIYFFPFPLPALTRIVRCERHCEYLVDYRSLGPSTVTVYVLSHFSRVQLFVTLWTEAQQAPLSMGFSRQEYWWGLPFPPPGDLPNPGTRLVSLVSSALADRFSNTSTTWDIHLAQGLPQNRRPSVEYKNAEIPQLKLQPNPRTQGHV